MTQNHPKQLEAAKRNEQAKQRQQELLNKVRSFSDCGIRFVNSDRVVVAYRGDEGSMLVSTAVRNKNDRANHLIGKVIAAERLIENQCVRLPIQRRPIMDLGLFFGPKSRHKSRESAEMAMKRQARQLLG